MKSKLLLAIGLLLTLFVNGQIQKDEFLNKFPLKLMTISCNSKPDSLIDQFEFTYDKDNKLLKVTSIKSIMTYDYNEFGLLYSKKTIIKDSINLKENVTTYKYNELKQLISEQSNFSNNIISYKYNDKGLLISSTSSKSNNLNTYEYDSLNKLIKKYTNGVLHASYEYSNSALVKEVKYGKDKSRLTSYEYDDKGLLIKIKVDDKIIENNVYLNGQLIEKVTASNPWEMTPCEKLWKYKY